MIALTRLNGSRFILNSDLIQTIESSPDTTVTLVNGEKLLVRESADEVCELTLNFRSHLLCRAGDQSPGATLATSGSTWQAAHFSPSPDSAVREVSYLSGKGSEIDDPD